LGRLRGARGSCGQDEKGRRKNAAQEETGAIAGI